jgi:biotin carboxyl carrier protein
MHEGKLPEQRVKSDITGTVWKILANAGDKVAEEDQIMILESMKMEIPVLAPDSGTVRKILVQEGEAVSEGQVVALLD